METLRIVFYHTRDILKGKGMRVFLALFCIGMLIRLYMEVLMLTMEVDSIVYMIAALCGTLIDSFATYVVLFLFIKAVRKERFTLKDVSYAVSKSPILIVIAFMLMFVQTIFVMAGQLLIPFHWLYLVFYSLVYAFFLVWNAIIAYGIYDGAGFTQLLSGGLFIMKEHIAEIFMASLFVMIWLALGQQITLVFTEKLLGTSLYAGLLIPGMYKAISVSAAVAIGFLLVHLVYFGIQYACMLPLYTYLAKLYEEERFICMPSGQRFLHEDKK